jgi:hypothetical protein
VFFFMSAVLMKVKEYIFMKNKKIHGGSISNVVLLSFVLENMHNVPNTRVKVHKF